MNDRQEIFLCDCHSAEHMLIVTVHDNGDDTRDFCLQISAQNYLPWYHRMWCAVKYIFGQPSLQWHDVMLSRQDVDKLAECVRVYKQEHV
jgi:hypothetical protein